MPRLVWSVVATASCMRASPPAAGAPGECNGRVGHELGDRFEGFLLVSCDGTEPVSSAPTGRPLLFNVSTGWCTSCQTETVEFQDLYEAHAGQFDVVQVLYEDDRSRVPEPSFCDEWTNGRFGRPLTFQVLLDDDRRFASRYFATPSTQMPLNLVVDPDGCVAAKWVGTPPPGEPERTLLDLL